MTEYYRLIQPRAQTLPVLVDVPHSGEWIPEDVLSEMVVEDKTLKRDLDLYVDQIWHQAPGLGATMLVSSVSRYVVDLNRAPDDVSRKTVLGAVAVKKPGYYHDRGVVWRTTTDGTPVMGGPMSRETFDRRIRTFHAPYHAEIAAQIARIKAQFGYCILLDAHSMPSEGRRGHTDPGIRRADIVPGDVSGSSCDWTLSALVCEHFSQQNFSTRLNKPYQGGWITRHFGQPDQGVHALQIEINRAIYMDETTFKVDVHGMQRLQSACASLLPKLADLLG